jgi:LacI family transcriptional regulator
VIGHFPEAIHWMQAAGAQLPDSHGFVCLNVLRTNHECASLDLQPAQIGARATELVVGQLLHHEMGVPTKPSLTTLTAQLLEGPTLRPRTKEAAEPPSWILRANTGTVASTQRAP